MRAIVEYPNHSGMRESSQTLDLATDAAEQIRVSRSDRLERYRLSRRLAARFKDDTHSPLAQWPQEFIRTDHRSGYVGEIFSTHEQARRGLSNLRQRFRLVAYRSMGSFAICGQPLQSRVTISNGRRLFRWLRPLK